MVRKKAGITRLSAFGIGATSNVRQEEHESIFHGLILPVKPYELNYGFIFALLVT